jgi:hypothetical protein
MGTAVLAVGFLGYLTYAARAAPTASCGCLGGAHARVSWRGFGRAGLLLCAAVVAAVPATAWWSSLSPVGSPVVFAGEIAAIVALSPELDRFWLLPARRLRIRLTHPLADAPDVVPLHATVSMLERSDTYRRVASLLTSDVREHWEEDGWRIVCFAARYQGRPATAVFAVSLHDDPDAIRVSFVDDEDAELEAAVSTA